MSTDVFGGKKPPEQYTKLYYIAYFQTSKEQKQYSQELI